MVYAMFRCVLMYSCATLYSTNHHFSTNVAEYVKTSSLGFCKTNRESMP